MLLLSASGNGPFGNTCTRVILHQNDDGEARSSLGSIVLLYPGDTMLLDLNT
jgi:hypothetical protein